jgi:hypothetical protein
MTAAERSPSSRNPSTITKRNLVLAVLSLIAVVAFFANLNQSLSVFMVLVPPTFRDKVIVEGESSHQLSSSIPELLKVTNTDHWQVWDRQGPLHENLNLTCSWAPGLTFAPRQEGTMLQLDPCALYPSKKMTSGFLKTFAARDDGGNVTR